MTEAGGVNRGTEPRTVVSLTPTARAYNQTPPGGAQGLPVQLAGRRISLGSRLARAPFSRHPEAEVDSGDERWFRSEQSVRIWRRPRRASMSIVAEAKSHSLLTTQGSTGVYTPGKSLYNRCSGSRLGVAGEPVGMYTSQRTASFPQPGGAAGFFGVPSLCPSMDNSPSNFPF